MVNLRNLLEDCILTLGVSHKITVAASQLRDEEVVREQYMLNSLVKKDYIKHMVNLIKTPSEYQMSLEKRFAKEGM